MQTEHDHDSARTDFDCAACGFGRLVARTDGSVPCPNCEESYSLVSRDGFTLIEANGWIARATIEPRTDPVTGTASR